MHTVRSSRPKLCCCQPCRPGCPGPPPALPQTPLQAPAPTCSTLLSSQLPRTLQRPRSTPQLGPCRTQDLPSPLACSRTCQTPAGQPRRHPLGIPPRGSSCPWGHPPPPPPAAPSTAPCTPSACASAWRGPRSWASQMSSACRARAPGRSCRQPRSPSTHPAPLRQTRCSLAACDWPWGWRAEQPVWEAGPTASEGQLSMLGADGQAANVMPSAKPCVLPNQTNMYNGSSDTVAAGGPCLWQAY